MTLLNPTPPRGGARPRPAAPAFRFSRMESLVRGRAVRTVTVDGVEAAFVADPALIRRILTRDSTRYTRGDLFQKARNLSRSGILADDESVHRHYRRLAHPYLRSTAVDDYVPVMREIARDTVMSWRAGQSVDVQAQMCRLAGAVALNTLLPGLPPQRAAVLTEHLARLSWEMIRRPLHGRAAVRARRQGGAGPLLRARQDLRTALAACLAGRPATAQPAAGYLAALLPAPRGAAPAPLTWDQVCDEAVMMLTAGTVTTASVMSWALYVISQEPLIEEKVLKDLAAGDTAAHASHGAGHGHGPAGYTLRFLTEVLRLYPPVWITCRKTVSQVTLGDLALPVGAHVLFSSYLLHRDSDRYPDPGRCDPDRWLSLRPAAGDVSFIPFGTGAKGCIGASFAWKELQILLGAVIQEWRLDVVPGSRIQAAPQTTLHPRRLLMVPRPR